jgi:dephospho-CoA kinase
MTIVVGLTGGIATGKSTVAQLLRQRGIRVVEADAIVYALQEPGQPVWRDIREAFGWATVDEHGRLNRRWLGRQVFSSPAARRRLNDLVHPAVRERLSAAVEEARREGLPLIVLDVPLLVESGLHRQVDRVWLVDCDPAQQRDRLKRRSGLTDVEVQQRLAAQWSSQAKRPYADVILDNRGTLEDLAREVDRALATVRSPS